MTTKEQALERLDAQIKELEDLINHNYTARANNPQCSEQLKIHDPAMWWSELLLFDLRVARFNQNKSHV